MPPPLSSAQASLLRWFDANRRDLPWRRSRDPWHVLVSEVMLQQTQVPRVLARFGPFLERFPTAAACAAAPVSAVIDAWVGLGFNRRAVALHRCATAVVERHGGSLPASLTELQRLPGIGPYTARALLAFAFECDAAVVDTNVARILARRTGRPLTATEAQGCADRAAPPGHGWAWNQAMLDLGALVCTKREPACGACPLREGCAWRGATASTHLSDPSLRTALTSGRQSRFEGSDRQGRGRLLAALRDGPVTAAELAPAMGWPGEPERARRVAATLTDDGLATRDEAGTWHLGGEGDAGPRP